MTVDTLFLDAGGVLVFPNWTRVSEALKRRGVEIDATALAEAEPHAKQAIDLGDTIQTTSDSQRGWLYFNLVLTKAGVALGPETDAALAELHAYHQVSNLWETVPEDVPHALDRFRALGLRLVVVSNANGTLHSMFSRVGLRGHVDVLLDSSKEGVEKPDPRLFALALERAGAASESTIHVGDLYHVDVVGARRAGLGAVLLDAAGLYDRYDCVRVRSLGELADRLADRNFPAACR